jgi:ribosomal protein L2
MNKKSNKLLINYKPVTPSRRHRIALKGEKNTPKISLLDPQIKFNKRKLIHGSPNIRGRNNQGRITTFTKGGGNQRRRRLIDHNR